jgi:D-alanyl-D-alanine carboxypeptidase
MPHPDLERFVLRFGRDESGRVIDVFHGDEWYAGEAYTGPMVFDYPAAWDAYPGHYRCYNPWQSNVRIVLRKGSLALLYPGGSEEPLTPLPDGSFRVGEDAESPERARFSGVVIDGQCQRVNLSGNDYDRFFTP